MSQYTWGSSPEDKSPPPPSDQKDRLLARIRNLQLAEGSLPAVKERLSAAESENKALRAEVAAAKESLRAGLAMAREKGAKMESLMKNIVAERNRTQSALERVQSSFREMEQYTKGVEEERDALVAMRRAPSPLVQRHSGAASAQVDATVSSLEELASSIEFSPQRSPPRPLPSTSAPAPTQVDFALLSACSVGTQTSKVSTWGVTPAQAAHLVVAALVGQRDSPLLTLQHIGSLPYLRYIRSDGRWRWFHAPTDILPREGSATISLVKHFVEDPDVRRVLLAGHVDIAGGEPPNPVGLTMRPEERSPLFRRSCVVFVASLLGSPLPTWMEWRGGELELVRAVSGRRDVVVMKGPSGVEAVVTSTSMLPVNNIAQITMSELGDDGEYRSVASWLPVSSLANHFTHYCILSTPAPCTDLEMRVATAILPDDGMLEVGLVVRFGEGSGAFDFSDSDGEMAEDAGRCSDRWDREYAANSAVLEASLSAYIVGGWDEAPVFPTVCRLSSDSSDCCITFKGGQLSDISALPAAPPSVTLVVGFGAPFLSNSTVCTVAFVTVPPSHSGQPSSPLREPSEERIGAWSAQDWAPHPQEEIERDESKARSRSATLATVGMQVLPRVVSVQIDGRDWLLSEVDLGTLRAIPHRLPKDDDVCSVGADTQLSHRTSRRGSSSRAPSSSTPKFRPVRPMRLAAESVSAPFVGRYLKWVSAAMLVAERHMIATAELYSTSAASQCQATFDQTALEEFHGRLSEIYVTYVERKHRLFSAECHWRSEALVHQASAYARRTQEWILRTSGLLVEHALEATSILIENLPEDLAVGVMQPDYVDDETIATHNNASHVVDWALATTELSGDWFSQLARVGVSEIVSLAESMAQAHTTALMRYRTHRLETDGLYLKYEELEEELQLAVDRMEDKDAEIRALSAELQKAGEAAVELQSANQHMRRRFAREMTIRDDVIAKAKVQVLAAQRAGVANSAAVPWPDEEASHEEVTPPPTPSGRHTPRSVIEKRTVNNPRRTPTASGYASRLANRLL